MIVKFSIQTYKYSKLTMIEVMGCQFINSVYITYKKKLKKPINLYFIFIQITQYALVIVLTENERMCKDIHVSNFN